MSEAQKAADADAGRATTSAFSRFKGNFDDCQRGVESPDGRRGFHRSALGDRGYTLSSANSINFGRLVPQSRLLFLGVRAALRKRTDRSAFGETSQLRGSHGQFRRISSRDIWQSKMGLAGRRKLVGASNRNNVLDNFLPKRACIRRDLSLQPDDVARAWTFSFQATSSGFCSTFSGNDGASGLMRWMASFSGSGKDFDIGPEALLDETSARTFLWGWADEAIQSTTRNPRDIRKAPAYHVLIDPHSAVGISSGTRQLLQSGGKLAKGRPCFYAPRVPFKFASDVCLRALTGIQYRMRKDDVYRAGGISPECDPPTEHHRAVRRSGAAQGIVSLRRDEMKQAVLRAP